MPMLRNLRDTITYWRVTGNDGFGGYTLAAPTVLRARWTEGQQKFVNASGEEDVSQATVYLESDVVIGDWIALGNYKFEPDPFNPAEGVITPYRVRGFSRVANLRNSTNLRTAFI